MSHEPWTNSLFEPEGTLWSTESIAFILQKGQLKPREDETCSRLVLSGWQDWGWKSGLLTFNPVFFPTQWQSLLRMVLSWAKLRVTSRNGTHCCLITGWSFKKLCWGSSVTGISTLAEGTHPLQGEAPERPVWQGLDKYLKFLTGSHFGNFVSQASQMMSMNNRVFSYLQKSGHRWTDALYFLRR